MVLVLAAGRSSDVLFMRVFDKSLSVLLLSVVAAGAAGRENEAAEMVVFSYVSVFRRRKTKQ